MNMSTIDGTNILIEDIGIDSDVDLSLSNILGSNENQLGENGMPGLRISISARATSATDYDTVMAAIMAPGQKELVIDSGWAYRVYTDRKSLDRKSAISYKFSVDFLTVDPYVYTTASTTRSKSITSNGQQWSADDSAQDIDISGNVTAAPDIRVTAGDAGGYTREGELFEETDPTEWNDRSNTTYSLIKEFALPAVPSQLYNIQELKCEVMQDLDVQVRYAINDGSETTIITWSEYTSGSYVEKSHTCDISTGINEALDIRFYAKMPGGGGSFYDIKNCYHKTQAYKKAGINDLVIYNTTYDEVVCNVSNEVFPDEVVRINADGTGHIDYDDDFTTDKYLDASYNYGGLTYDYVNDELDIADGGHIAFAIDTKYPVTGIPTLTAQIDITAGTPIIQIALDDNGAPGTWYEIDTAIVDNVSTIYNLVSGSDVKFVNQTKIWISIDCGGTGTVTCTVKSLALDIDIITIDAQMPIINTGGANTFQCDQSSDSSLSCTVDLIYPDRKWA